MNVETARCEAGVYVASVATAPFVCTSQDFLELLAFGTEHRTNLFLLKETDFPAAFYDLKSGLAGEILQKLANYHARAAIVGSFQAVQGKKFHELISEANKGGQVLFSHDREQALRWLAGRAGIPGGERLSQ